MYIPNFWAPLSGDVNQGFINIYNSATSNPAKERKIATEVASYGSQLGTIIDALSAVIEKNSGSKKQDERIKKFNQLADKINNMGEYDSILEKLNHLKHYDPDRYRKIISQLDE